MPIDPELATTAAHPVFHDRWDADRVVLYHLGLGAGGRAALPDDLADLAYISERCLKVLPTFSVIPAFEGVRPAMQGPGLDYHLSKMLHGEQQLTVFHPLPVDGEVVITPSVEAVFDKGKSAVIVLRSDMSATDGTALCTNRFRLVVRGEGGFGGDPGPAAEVWQVDGPPAYEEEVAILPQQAAIYRLSGDKNPLHIDPTFARRAGFERPILHGLCTYGVVCKSVVDGMLDGDVTAVRDYRARFAAPMYPGEVLTVRAWRADGKVRVEALVRDRGVKVIANGVIELRS